MELGVYTFAELTSDEVSPRQRLRDLLEEIELADQVGLDIFGVGEHHRPDFAVSAPAVVLAAAAERTKDIRLTSAVSVLSSDEPVHSDCRWRLRSSAGCRRASPRLPSCTAAQARRPGTAVCRSASTPTATSPSPRKRRSTTRFRTSRP